VTVGVVGFPNVGKSSLINSLKRAKVRSCPSPIQKVAALKSDFKVCAVAAQPGHTKDVQSIQLERGIKIIDSPGVVFDDDMTPGLEGGPTKGSILLRNVVKVEDVDDVMLVGTRGHSPASSQFF
jgi:nuclear GTP-binding protein